MSPQAPPFDPSAESARDPGPLLSAFASAAGRSAERLFFAPGRVNLLGAHLDYNGGPVLPAAIDRGTLVATAARQDGQLVLRSTLEPREYRCSLSDLPERPQGAWFDYPLGVARELCPRAPFARGVELHFGGDLPVGAGLSSSASICVATALALTRHHGLAERREDWVSAALRAEREFVGVQCGIMDPFAVGHGRAGHLLWLECVDGRFEHLPFDGERLAIAVADSGVRRELARGEFNTRVAQCAEAFSVLGASAPGARCLAEVPLGLLDELGPQLDPVVQKRARHVLEEVARARAARVALSVGDWAAFGAAMVACHQSLRELYEVSTPELDLLVEAALEVDGVLGARLVGAGFGGSTVMLLAPSAKAALHSHIASRFERAFGRAPAVRFFRPDAGPREIALS